MAAAAAPAIISLAGSVLSRAFSVIAQHSLRLKDAKAENSAVPQAVTALQQDFEEIAQALESGQASPSDAIHQLIAIEGGIEGFLKSLVGKPGTAWAGAPSGCPGADVPKTESGVHNCDKSCTAGCCIYYNYLEPAIDCFIKRLQRTRPGGSFGVAIPAIPGNKYGFPNFPAYSITVRLPSESANLVDGMLGPQNPLSSFFAKFTGGGASGTVQGTSDGSAVAVRARGTFPTYIFLALIALVAFFVFGRK